MTWTSQDRLTDEQRQQRARQRVDELRQVLAGERRPDDITPPFAPDNEEEEEEF